MKENNSLLSLFRVHDSFLNLKVISKDQTSDTLTGLKFILSLLEMIENHIFRTVKTTKTEGNMLAYLQ